ncbi:hypothetical protein LIER_37042 [Lithospermum erythrorhizon]|uniref:Uncharacterized protein n=1 Tax=Lithospermum erythrorhizon TaxID=34254 RepID=A0AAV3PE86_LITER
MGAYLDSYGLPMRLVVLVEPELGGESDGAVQECNVKLSQLIKCLAACYKEGSSETAFQGHVFALDNNLVVFGLGYDYGLDLETIWKQQSCISMGKWNFGSTWEFVTTPHFGVDTWSPGPR